MPRSTKTHFGHCHIHERNELVRWIQRGFNNPEWIRVCATAEKMIFDRDRRPKVQKQQLDLFPASSR